MIEGEREHYQLHSIEEKLLKRLGKESIRHQEIQQYDCARQLHTNSDLFF